MPPLRRGRVPARARAGRGRPYGRRQHVGAGDTAGSVRDNTAVPVPPVNPVPLVAPVRVHDMGVQPDTMPGGVEVRRLENLITESVAKGVELGIHKALSAIESWPASANRYSRGSRQWLGCPVLQYQHSQDFPSDQLLIVFLLLRLHSPLFEISLRQLPHPMPFFFFFFFFFYYSRLHNTICSSSRHSINVIEIYIECV